MTDWTLYVADTNGNPIGELAAATGRKATFRLDGSCDASWNIDGRNRDAATLVELATDVFVRWGRRAMGRFRVGASSDDISSEGHNCQFAAVDYRGLLDRRQTFAPLTWTGVEISSIGWELINYTQTGTALPGGNLGIGLGAVPTLGNITHEVPDGKKIGEAINDLSKLAVGAGFEWEIDANLDFNVWAERGIVRDFVCEYGSNVISVKRTVDTTSYANCVRASGADGVTPAVRYAADLAARPEGRIEMQDGNTDLTTSAAVASTAEADLARFGVIAPSYTMTFAPGRWNPDVLWLGDTAMYVIQTGRLNIVDSARVVEIAVSVGDDSGETVEVTFGARRPNFALDQRNYVSRLETLARR